MPKAAEGDDRRYTQHISVLRGIDCSGAAGAACARTPVKTGASERARLQAEAFDEARALDDASNSVLDLVHAGKLDEAEQAAREMLERYPQVPDGDERLGMIYEAREITGGRPSATVRVCGSSGLIPEDLIRSTNSFCCPSSIRRPRADCSHCFSRPGSRKGLRALPRGLRVP